MKRASIILVAALCVGCAGQTETWRYGAAAVQGLRAGIDAVEEHLPEENEDVDTAMATARASLDMGDTLVEMWQTGEEEPTAWTKWVTHALDAVSNLLMILKSCGVPIPDMLVSAVIGLQSLWLLVAGGLVGG